MLCGEYIIKFNYLESFHFCFELHNVVKLLESIFLRILPACKNAATQEIIFFSNTLIEIFRYKPLYFVETN